MLKLMVALVSDDNVHESICVKSIGDLEQLPVEIRSQIRPCLVDMKYCELSTHVVANFETDV